MKVVPVKCPQCGSPIQSKVRDRVFCCTRCNTMHIREEGVEKLDVEIGEFPQNAQGERIYMPFWRVYATLVVHSKRVEGGTLYKMTQWLKGASDSGNLFIFIPATELDNAGFRSLSGRYTSNPPKYSTRLNFGNVTRLPTTITRREAGHLADFVVVTMEAEQPGTLQRLNYTLTVNDTKLVYLPFTKGAQGMVPAV